MSRETLVEEHYMLASTEAALFVEEHARLILQRHPCLHEFVMAMGTWFFTKKKSHSRSLVPGEHEMVHPTDYDAPKYIAKGNGVLQIILCGTPLLLGHPLYNARR
jgi:hypothetical protein